MSRKRKSEMKDRG